MLQSDEKTRHKVIKNIHPPLALGVQFHGAMEWWGAGGTRTHGPSSTPLSFGFSNTNQAFIMFQSNWKCCLNRTEGECFFFFFLISPKCALLGVDYFELKMIKTQQTQEKLLASPLTAQNNVDYTAYARKRAITGENFNFRKIYPPGGANIYSSGTCSSHPPLGCLPPPWSPTPFSLAQGSV